MIPLPLVTFDVSRIEEGPAICEIEFEVTFGNGDADSKTIVYHLFICAN